MTFDLLKMIADGMGYVLTKCPENEDDHYKKGYWIWGEKSFHSDAEFDEHHNTLKGVAEFITNEVWHRKNLYKDALYSINRLKSSISRQSMKF